MPHDWVLDVLRDLGAYARKHDLPALAARADEALAVAEAEIAAARDRPARAARAGCLPRGSRAH